MSGPRVAFIGLGNIGRGITRNIATKGRQSSLVLYNRTTARAEALATELGGNVTVAKTYADILAQSDLVFICVGDDAALEAVIDGLLEDKAADLSTKTFVDCSTVHPDTSRKAEKDFEARGASFVASPVFGAPNMADAGQLIVVPAGKQEAIARAKPFYEGVTARATIDLSDGSGADIDVGRAPMLKLLGNTFILNTVGVVAEAVTAAETSGLGVDAFKQFMELFAPGPFAKYTNRMTSGDYYQREEPLFAVDLARKDLRHASSLAQAGGQRMRNVEVTDHLLQIVKAEKGANGDIAGVYGAARKEAGLKYENQ